MVNVGSKSHHHRGRDTLLEDTAQLALGVDLGSESGHAEIVLGADGRDTLLLDTTTHKTAGRGDEAEAQVDTSLDFVRDSLPERSVESTHSSLELGSSDPILGLVATKVRDSTLRALGKGRSLPEGLKTESQLGGNGLEVAADEDAGEAALEVGRVEHLERSAEVVTSVLVLELSHILTSRGN